MSHITCLKCGSDDHINGYGFAAGPLGAYTICNGCNKVLELIPDTEGLPEENCDTNIVGDEHDEP